MKSAGNFAPRRFAGALASLAAASACGPTATVSRAAPASRAISAATPAFAPAPSLGAGPTRVWLRLDVPLRGDFEDPWRSQAPSRLLVDRFADGTLRAVGHAFPPAALSLRGRTSPTRDRGLGLFVQRKTALHIESPGGPIIGWADVGAYLTILGFGAGGTEVVLPDYSAVRPGAWLVSAFVDSSALGIAELPTLFPPDGAADYVDVYAPIAATLAGAPFATTACGGVQVLSRDGGRLHVSQSRDGIHVIGWLAAAPGSMHGENSCQPRVVERGPRETEAPPLPPGYVPYGVGDAVNDPLGPTLRHGGVIVWMVAGDDGALRCLDWSAKKAETTRDKGVSGELRRDIITAGHRNEVTFSIQVDPRQGEIPSLVNIEGPTWSSENGEGVALCGTGYTVVAADATRVTLLRGTYLDGLAGYRPEDVEVWYLTHAACEAARHEAAGGPPSFAARVHRSGC